MSVTNCRIKILEEAKRKDIELTDDDLDRIQYHLDRSGGMTPDDIREAMKAYSEELKAKAEKELADDYATTTKSVQVLNQVTDDGKLTSGKDILENILRWIDGGEMRNKVGGNMDPADMAGDFLGRIQAIYTTAMDKHLPALRTGQLDVEVAIAIDALEQGKRPSTTNKTVLAIAEAFVNTNNAIFQIKKTIDPTLQKIQSYFVKQFHNTERMMGKKDEWLNDAWEIFGRETFAGNKEKGMAALSKFYDLQIGGKLGFGASNDYDVLKKLGLDRGFKAESPEKFVKYIQKWGYYTLADTMDKSMRETANSLALAMKFGPNRAETLRQLRMLVADRVALEDRRWLDARFEKEIKKAEMAATGALHAPPSSGFGRFTQAMKTLQYVAHGLAAPFRSLGDLAHQAMFLSRADGSGYVQNLFDVVTTWSRNMLDTSARNEGLREVVLVSHILRGDVLSNQGMTGTAGKLTRLAQTGSKWSGLNRMTDSSRATVGVLIAKKLGDYADKAHMDLPKQLQEELARYNIGDIEWELLAQSAQERTIAGHKYKLIAGDTADILEDAVIEKYLRDVGRWTDEGPIPQNIISMEKLELGNKIGTYINQAATIGTSTANTRALSFMLQGTTADEPVGIALRLIWQFKASSVANFNNYARTYYSGGGLHGSMSLLAMTGVASAGLWAAGDAALNILNGKEPEGPSSDKYWLKLVAGSGIGGIYGDIATRALMSDRGIDPRSAVYDFLGPTARTAAQVLGGPKEALAEVAATVPIVNSLPGIRGAWEFYVLNAFKEFANTGYVSKMERRMQKDNRSFLLADPSESPTVEMVK